MVKQITIDICAITFKRPDRLGNLLASLSAMKVDDKYKVNLFIIDNDENQSAREVVTAFNGEASFDVVYLVEAKRGISEARNRALTTVQGDYVCFVDDDETVTANWLNSLVAAAIKHDADVVFGPVKRVLPDNAPAWLIANNFFEQKSRKTGTPVQYGGSGNVLIKKDALGQPMELFNPAYSLTGGGDTEFFYRLFCRGRQLIWCDEAEAEEYPDASRFSIKWYVLRSFRNGQVYFRVFINNEKSAVKYRFLFINFLGILRNSILLPFFLVVRFEHFVFLLGKIGMAAGFLTASLPHNSYYKEYT